MSGLGNANMNDDIIVEHDTDEKPIRNKDDSGNVISIEHSDGSIEISLDGKPIENAPDDSPKGWWANLADKMDKGQLSGIADDLMRGIEDDLSSRSDWVEERAAGIKLLGLKLNLGENGQTDNAPVAGISTVRHPLLLEAVLRFQANARSEFLPTDGPTKIRDDSNNQDQPRDELADCLETDMNHYMTVTAPEYYPDTDRMFLLLGFGGSTFKKVYFCPLRNRPVSETVDADDLIVNNSATDLENAQRVTHRIYMRPAMFKRMQLVGAYLDIDLPAARQPNQDAVQQEKKDQQGIRPRNLRPEDNEREIYECYCELDIPGYEHKIRGQATGLPVPYRVTIDVSSREILSIVRNFNKSTEELPVARKTFVKYSFIPGFGFYDIGLLQILGNTTNALTAAWREMLDAGMFANFPGFLYSDQAGRQNTNIFRIPPGGGAPIKTNGMSVRDAVMPLPYKEPGPAMMSLTEKMEQTGQRVGGTAELAVGEGRQDAPVGTTLAMIDQAVKVMNSVHKRMHTAQSQEISMMMDCFREHPESFWKRNNKPAAPWDEETFRRALDDHDLVPVADPNTSSHMQRVMKVMGLKQLQQQSPKLYDPVAVDKAALQALGWSNPDRFMVSPEQAQQPDPEIMKGIEELKIKKQDADARTLTAQTNAQKAGSDAKIAEAGIALDAQRLQIDAQPDAPEQQDPAKLIEAQAKLDANRLKEQDNQIKAADVHLDAMNRAADRESRERVALAGIIKEGEQNPEGLAAVKPLLTPDYVNELKED